MPYKKPRNAFERFSDFASDIVGSPYWFVFSVLMVLVWFPSGFIIGFNEFWQLLINTFTTILTFLMMSLLHSSQSKWERNMELMEKRQERTLRLLEQKTTEIKVNVEEVRAQNGSSSLSGSGDNPPNDSGFVESVSDSSVTESPTPPEKITSIL